MKTLLRYAFSFLGTPYIWGGQSFEGVDCSGFVQLVLASVGMKPPGDLTANGLFRHFLSHPSTIKRSDDVIECGDLLFFGTEEPEKRTGKLITHVALAVDSHRMIEAGGGNSAMVNRQTAALRNACVKISPIARRGDLVAVIHPDYPAWLAPVP